MKPYTLYIVYFLDVDPHGPTFWEPKEISHYPYSDSVLKIMADTWKRDVNQIELELTEEQFEKINAQNKENIIECEWSKDSWWKQKKELSKED